MVVMVDNHRKCVFGGSGFCGGIAFDVGTLRVARESAYEIYAESGRENKKK
jgi:hypothetical protein